MKNILRFGLLASLVLMVNVGLSQAACVHLQVATSLSNQTYSASTNNATVYGLKMTNNCGAPITLRDLKLNSAIDGDTSDGNAFGGGYYSDHTPDDGGSAIANLLSNYKIYKFVDQVNPLDATISYASGTGTLSIHFNANGQIDIDSGESKSVILKANVSSHGHYGTYQDRIKFILSQTSQIIFYDFNNDAVSPVDVDYGDSGNNLYGNGGLVYTIN